MKQAIIPMLAVLLCINSQAQNTTSKTTQGKKTSTKPESGKLKTRSGGTAQPVSLPYPVMYSSQFAMGNPAHAKMVLDMYKEYEDNNFSGESRFSDTATFVLPDGQVLQGAATIGNTLAQGRNSMPNAAFTFSAVLPVHSIDKGHDWVLVWGMQPFSSSGGSEPTDFHAIWRVNKDQKIDFVQVFEGKSPGQ